MAKIKITKFNSGLLALVLVVVGLPITYMAATSKVGTLNNQQQHADYNPPPIPTITPSSFITINTLSDVKGPLVPATPPPVQDQEKVNNNPNTNCSGNIAWYTLGHSYNSAGTDSVNAYIQGGFVNNVLCYLSAYGNGTEGPHLAYEQFCVSLANSSSYCEYFGVGPQTRSIGGVGFYRGCSWASAYITYHVATSTYGICTH